LYRDGNPLTPAPERPLAESSRVRQVRPRQVNCHPRASHLDKDGIEPAANTPEEFAAQVKTDLARWAKVVKAAGSKLD